MSARTRRSFVVSLKSFGSKRLMPLRGDADANNWDTEQNRTEQVPFDEIFNIRR